MRGAWLDPLSRLWPQAVKRLLQVSQSRDASLVEFPGAYHELFMGAERDASVKALRDWCAAWLSPCMGRPLRAPGADPRRTPQAVHGRGARCPPRSAAGLVRGVPLLLIGRGPAGWGGA